MSGNEAIPRADSPDYRLLYQNMAEDCCWDTSEMLEELRTIAKRCHMLAEKIVQRSTHRNKDSPSSKTEQNAAEDETERFKQTTSILKVANDILSYKIDLECGDFIEVKSSDPESLRQSNDALKAENIKLRQICKDITEINKRWQKYDWQVQLYIHKLEKALQEKEQVPKTDINLLERREKTDDLTEPERENLFAQYNDLLKETNKLKEELEGSRLMEEALRNQLTHIQEEISHLNLQLVTYKEDYEIEKNERITAQETAFKASQELIKVKNQLRECRKRLKEIQEASRSPGTETSPRGATASSPFANRTGHSSSFNFRKREAFSSSNGGILIGDGSSDIPNSDNSMTSEELSECGDLQCPDCKTLFPKEKRQEYLEHYEECQGNKTS